MEFVALVLAAIIIVIAVSLARDSKNQKRCADATKVLMMLGYQDKQIMNELNRRGWVGGWSGKADTLETIAGEAMGSGPREKLFGSM